MCLAMAQIQEGMQEKNFRKQLAAAVRNIQWSYAIFWSSSASQHGVLTWGDGYYNGDIKTMKTTQPIEFKADQIGLQRSEQLRELYESLLADENNQQTIRQPASLSPEDLTASEWYYLVCMSFTFSPGQGLPGRALARNQHIWVNNAQFADSRTFSRSLLAKSASIQTVVCFPFMDGVLEFGATEQVLEDCGLIQQVRTAFWDLPISACSEQSISNSPFERKDEEGTVHPIPDKGIDYVMDLENQNLISEHHSPLQQVLSPFAFSFPMYVPNEETELGPDRVEELNPNMDELRNGSPNYSSNDSFKMDDCMPFVNTPMILSSPRGRRTKNSALNCLQEGNFAKDLVGDETHYQKTLLSILKNSKGSDSMLFFLNTSCTSSFTIWTRNFNLAKPVGNQHQKMLKEILVDMSWIALQHQKENGIENKVLKPDGDDAGANHVLSERRRREKLNEKFSILRSLVPSVSKVDKASILADTIEYLKELERRVNELESNKETVEYDTRDRRKHPGVSERTYDNYNNENTNKRKPTASKRKACVINEHDRSIISKNNAVKINVSVIEKEVMLEMTCPWRDCLLIEIINAISHLQLDSHSVQSSPINGILTVTLKAKFRGLTVVAPGMVKRALQRIIGN